MFEHTKIYYINSKEKQIEFSLNSPFKLFIDGLDGLSSNSVNISQSSIVGQIGNIVETLKIDSKTLTFDGEITEDIQNNRKQMISTIYPGDYGKVVFEDEKSKYYLEVIAITTPVISNHEDIEQFQFSVLAPYPFWRKYRAENAIRFGEFKSTYKYPQSFSNKNAWRISKKLDSKIQNIFNSSSYDLGFVVQFRCGGNVKNPYIVNTMTQEKIAIDTSSVNTLDTTDYIFEIGTVDNQKFVKMITSSKEEIPSVSSLAFDSTFFKLHPGDNPLRFGAEINEQVLEATIRYDEILVGI